MRLTVHSANRLKALLLILLAMFLAEKFVSGKLYYYIGPRFGWLSVVGVGLLILLAGSYKLISDRDDAQHIPPDHAPSHGHRHDPHNETVSAWPLVIVAFPLILGITIPARPLGANAIANRGITTDVAGAADQGSRLTVVPSERNILDWVRVMNEDPDPAALDGQEADIVGFVYRDARFDAEQFMVGRFTLTCCVADALAIGVVVQTEEPANYPADTWVRVRGTFEAGIVDGSAVPVLMASEITPVQPPEQPYLYP